MLTPEEKARIEEEERKRHAEEQYRNQVRTGLRQSSEPAVTVTKSVNWSFLKILGGLLAIVAVIVVITNLTRSNTSAEADPSQPAARRLPITPPVVRYVPKTEQIASGQIVVKHGGFVSYKVTITSEMRSPVLTGNFTASGGRGNDIAAAVADESNYTNWINGHQAKVFWHTEGLETTGSFELRLAPGTHYLALSNRFSAISDKYVFLNANLNYQQAEP